MLDIHKVTLSKDYMLLLIVKNTQSSAAASKDYHPLQPLVPATLSSMLCSGFKNTLSNSMLYLQIKACSL